MVVVLRKWQLGDAYDYYVIARCKSCKDGTTKTYEGNKLPCPYCSGTMRVKRVKPHPSHKMSKWETTILAPSGTERFYRIRHCTKCHEEEWKGNGHFLHGLGKPCSS